MLPQAQQSFVRLVAGCLPKRCNAISTEFLTSMMEMTYVAIIAWGVS